MTKKAHKKIAAGLKERSPSRAAKPGRQGHSRRRGDTQCAPIAATAGELRRVKKPGARDRRIADRHLRPFSLAIEAIEKSLARAMRQVSKYADSPRRELSYEQFQQLIEIAQVPHNDAKRRWLYEQICLLLNNGEWVDHQTRLSELPALRLLLRASNEYATAWNALTRAAAKYKNAALQYREACDAWCAIRCYRPKLSKRIVPKRVLIESEFLEYLASAADTPLARWAAGSRNPRSVARTTSYLRLASFLRVFVAEAGGTLTFNKNDENKGTLCRALHFLAPYLPPGAIPARLPLGTIARIHKDTKDIQTLIREKLTTGAKVEIGGGAIGWSPANSTSPLTARASRSRKPRCVPSPSPATNSIRNGITPSHPDNRVPQLFWSKP